MSTSGAPAGHASAGHALVGRRASWWLPLALIVASEYEFRRRPDGLSLNNSVDLWIVVELGVYSSVGIYVLVRLEPTLRRHPLVVWLAAYCIAAAVSAVYSPYPGLAMVRGVQMVIILLTVLRFIDDADVSSVRRFLHGYVVLTSVSILIGVLSVTPKTPTQVGRFTWLHTHSVTAAAMLAMSTVILFGMWLMRRAARLPWRRWVYALLLVVHVVALLATRTRGSIGAAMIAVLVITMMWLRTEGKRDFLVTMVVALVAVALTLAGPIVSFLLRDSNPAQLASFNERTDLWSRAIEVFLTQPVGGLGLAASRGLFFDATGLGGAHNAYVNVLVDTGLVGMFFWGGSIVLIFVYARRARRVAKTIDPAATLMFDTVTIIGLMVCQLVNGVTAEFAGSGVSASAMMLFLTAAWVLAASDAANELVPRRVDRPSEPRAVDV